MKLKVKVNQLFFRTSELNKFATATDRRIKSTEESAYPRSFASVGTENTYFWKWFRSAVVARFVSGCDRLTRIRENVRGRECAVFQLAAELRVWREYVGRVARGRRWRCGAGATVRLDSACHTAYRPLASPAALIRRRRARHCEKTFNNSFFIILTDYETINSTWQWFTSAR